MKPSYSIPALWDVSVASLLIHPLVQLTGSYSLLTTLCMDRRMDTFFLHLTIWTSPLCIILLGNRFDRQSIACTCNYLEFGDNRTYSTYFCPGDLEDTSTCQQSG
jgi:hypothetical protein